MRIRPCGRRGVVGLVAVLGLWPIVLPAQQTAPVTPRPAIRLSPAVLQRATTLAPRTNSSAARTTNIARSQEATAATPAVNAAVPTTTTTASATAATNAPLTAEDRRLQDLLKLSLDRRPASILKAQARKAGGEPAFTNEIDRFQADVLTSDWPAVRKFLAALPEKQVAPVYRALLLAMQRTPPNTVQPAELAEPGVVQPANRVVIEPVFLPEDVLGLADAKPTGLEETDLDALGRLLSRALSRHGAIEPFLNRLEAGTDRLGGGDEAKRRLAARLLIAAGRLTDAARFLPGSDAAKEQKDYAALELRARVLMAEGVERSDAAALRGAWDLNLTLLADKSAPATNREVALQRAVELMPLLARDRSRDWLRDSFQKEPARGMAILASIGTLVSQGASERDLEKRRRTLELQRRVVEELISVAGTNVAAWRPTLTLLAVGWLGEADRSKTRHRPRTQNQQIIDFDAFGNPIYSYYDPGVSAYQNPSETQAVGLEALLATAPGTAWIDACDASVRLRTRALLAEIFIKLEQEEKAVPWIESLVAEQPKVALNLANDLLRSWAVTKDPNRDSRRNQRIYYGPYGNSFSQGIPITRAVQVRNLQQLAEVLTRLRPLGPLDDKALVNAFAASHSQAEVFRVSDITQVLGSPDQLGVTTLAELLQAMRERLARQWRQPAVQQQAKTKRSDKDIQAEVNRGYELVLDLTAKAVAKRSREWRLWTVRGATYFDWAEYQYGKDVALAIYTEKRDEAFAMLEKAAGLYAQQVGTLDEKDQTPMVFQQWFNTTLGASDLAFLTRQQKLDTNRIDQIRAALLALPAGTVDRHLALLGKALVDAITALPPELKPRYLKAGLRLVGDHESADPARKLVAYYDGLLQEVEFRVRLDGDATVGHGRPFGLHLVIRHSDAVGRESGGFAKYLQNQQAMQYYYNPYGGQPVNYRDDLEKKIRETLQDRFEITSLTWHDDKVEPRGYGRPEWRETPLAYILLQAKDAATDRIPPLQLDLDFLDRRGKVILPVESQTVLLDARPDRPAPRAMAKVRLTQILDDRDVASGKLSLEIKAIANGIIPPLEELVDVSMPGFRIEKNTDHGLAVTKLDTDGDAITPVCERGWLLSLVPVTANAVPDSFQFPKARVPVEEAAWKHYQDADLVSVKETVALAGAAGLHRTSPWTVVGSVAVVAICGIGLWFLLRRGRTVASAPPAPYVLPVHCTPFSVLNLLRAMEQDARLPLSSERRAELAAAIRELETRYFAPAGSTNGQADLDRIAREWVTRVVS